MILVSKDIKTTDLGALGWLSWLSVQHLISAQVTILRFMGLSPVSGSALTAQSLLQTLSLPLSLSLKINKLKKKKTYLDLYLLIWTKIHDLSDIPLPEKRQVDQGSTNFFF